MAFGATVRSELISAGYSPEKANSITAVTIELERYLADHGDLLQEAVGLKGAYDDARRVFTGTRHMRRASGLASLPVSSRYGAYSWRAANGVFAAFLSHAAPFAKSQGVELEECSLAISRLSLAVIGAGTGAVSLPTGFGAILLLLAVKEAFESGKALGEHCVLPLTE